MDADRESAVDKICEVDGAGLARHRDDKHEAKLHRPRSAATGRGRSADRSGWTSILTSLSGLGRWLRGTVGFQPVRNSSYGDLFGRLPRTGLVLNRHFLASYLSVILPVRLRTHAT